MSSSSSALSSALARSGAKGDPAIRPPPSQSWRTFLTNHAEVIWAADLLVVQTLTFKTLYVLFFISHGRRQVVHFEVTAHPTAAWVWRQLIEATPWDRKPRHLIQDLPRETTSFYFYSADGPRPSGSCLTSCMDDEGLLENFSHLSPSAPTVLTHLEHDGGQVRVVLDGRAGRILWVRPLDADEPESSEPITVQPGDGVVPFTPLHSMSINTSPTVGDTTGFMLAIPLVEVRRDDAQRQIWIRTRRIGEPEPTSRVRAPWGYTVKLDAGALVVEIEWIDRMFPPDEDGYAPLTNTIWTWMNIGPAPDSDTLTRYLLAAARRLDAAHRQFQRVRERLDDFDPSAPGPHARLAVFEIVGDIETAVVALSRAIDMAAKLGTLVPISTSLPASVATEAVLLTELRNAYEHIEDRAQGQVRSKPDPQALTIFDWSSLFQDGAITYAGYSLRLSDVPGLILDTRTFLKNAAAAAKEAVALGATPSPTWATLD